MIQYDTIMIHVRTTITRVILEYVCRVDTGVFQMHNTKKNWGLQA